MRIEQQLFKDHKFKRNPSSDDLLHNGPQLVLGFAAKSILEHENLFAQLQSMYPLADIITCSTAGEIYHDKVFDDSASIVAIEFEKTGFVAASINITDYDSSYDAGQDLFYKIYHKSLGYILVISDGALINGSELVRGIESVNTANIPVTGGLAGDADQFEYTIVGCNNDPARGNIVAVGFYGKELKVSHGSMGGWDVFGPEMTVTAAVENRLYKIDGRNAIDVYKEFLGDSANNLPGSALLFPLAVQLELSGAEVVRTILSINYEEQCMVFAGDIPEGSKVRMMRANFDKLVDAATNAASAAVNNFGAEYSTPKLALLISCVGRKLILGDRTSDEVIASRKLFAPATITAGFYSYGEISPGSRYTRCELHNQTMTITTIDEN